MIQSSNKLIVPNTDFISINISDERKVDTQEIYIPDQIKTTEAVPHKVYVM